MKTLQLIWSWLDGNKTILCAFVWLLISKGIINLSPEWIEVVNWVMGALTSGAFIDHVRKGYLTTAKGA